MKYAFVHGVILDGSKEMEPLTGHVVLVEEEKIEGIVPEDSFWAQGYELIDLKGKYIMPGLINMHIHLPSSGRPSKKEKDPAKTVELVTKNALTRWVLYKLCASMAKTQLYSGVTTVRTVGGVLDVDSRLRDRILTGCEEGPRILAANTAITAEGGHMAGSVAYAAKDTEDAVRMVRRVAYEKADLIKLMITGGVMDATVKGEPGILRMSPETVKACCDEAHKLGLPVAAHVESPEGVRVALENGVDSIEHGAKPDDDIIRLFQKTGAYHVSTISPALPYALFDTSVSGATELSKYNGNVVFEGIIACAKACLANDIPVGLGTDTGCPFITHYDMWRELYYFHKYCDVTPAFALYSATKHNAELLGIGRETGSIEAGKDADLIVTEGNPLEDLTVLRNVSMVMSRGKLIRDPKVKKMKQVETELDKFL